MFRKNDCFGGQGPYDRRFAIKNPISIDFSLDHNTYFVYLFKGKLKC